MSTERDMDAKLIRWLEGDLTGEELAAFESSTAYQDYKKIIDSSDQIDYPIMDQEAVFSSIQNKISSSKPKVKEARVIPFGKWIISIASIAILTLAVLSLFPKTVNVSTEIGQYVSHILPDDSKVEINGNSSVNYKSNFEDERIITLDGEAFFDVTKGKSFVVETKKGSVSVLGTSFNVFSRNDIFTVACKSGKVKVESKDQSVILQKGERIRIDNKSSTGKEVVELNEIGTWINGESYFSKAQLDQIVLALASEYDIQIDLPAKYKSKIFTGSFVHGDIKKALKMVFSPLGISYTLDDEGKVLISAD